jgi:hypothetical protein
MPTFQLRLPEVTLRPESSSGLPEPRYHINQTIKFTKVPTGDWGRICGLIYATSVTVQAVGYHYLITLDPSSKSRTEIGILSDWVFEDDAELVRENLLNNT